jgi:hypothetical protein
METRMSKCFFDAMILVILVDLIAFPFLPKFTFTNNPFLVLLDANIILWVAFAGLNYCFRINELATSWFRKLFASESEQKNEEEAS